MFVLPPADFLFVIFDAYGFVDNSAFSPGMFSLPHWRRREGNPQCGCQLRPIPLGVSLNCRQLARDTSSPQPLGRPAAKLMPNQSQFVLIPTHLIRPIGLSDLLAFLCALNLQDYTLLKIKIGFHQGLGKEIRHKKSRPGSVFKATVTTLPLTGINK